MPCAKCRRGNSAIGRNATAERHTENCHRGSNAIRINVIAQLCHTKKCHRDSNVIRRSVIAAKFNCGMSFEAMSPRQTEQCHCGTVVRNLHRPGTAAVVPYEKSFIRRNVAATEV
ncbi:hypothetical protein DPMN_075918 [Dreissena polymorpha]|uniref:Uncharacterized protein n=1 Tax=Dreissena polymorpha TaxID=45954 RepID=A0A9D4BPY6_DREPO|nr:hypothetical protein DPMN_075918 [Dreissena polymorpha]